MNLLNLMNSDLFKAFCFLIFLGFLILVAYEKGYSNCELKMQSEMREVELKNSKLIIEKERALRIEQDKIVNDYLETIEIRCYTESELLRKIESSLDIAKQCDELTVKYNALLKVCK